MHYMRMYRYGRLDKKKRKYRFVSDNGYYCIHEPEHPLVSKNGYVYEHRYVYYNEVSKDTGDCRMCGKELTWVSACIDHINENKKDNRPENLRPLCMQCNAQRSRKEEWIRNKRVMTLTIDGETHSVAQWVKKSGVDISPSTVIRRKKVMGYSDFDALYSPKITHNGKS